MNLTHDYLNERGAMFLKYQKHCGVVAVELVTYIRSIPDVMGFKRGCSYMIESKMSRSDFRADFKKSHRHPDSLFAVGNYRYYLCPEGLIQAEEIPEHWGLLWIKGKKITIIKEIDKSEMIDGFYASPHKMKVRPELDRAMLYSIARRTS